MGERDLRTLLDLLALVFAVGCRELRPAGLHAVVENPQSGPLHVLHLPDGVDTAVDPESGHVFARGSRWGLWGRGRSAVVRVIGRCPEREIRRIVRAVVRAGAERVIVGGQGETLRHVVAVLRTVVPDVAVSYALLASELVTAVARAPRVGTWAATNHRGWYVRAEVIAANAARVAAGDSPLVADVADVRGLPGALLTAAPGERTAPRPFDVEAALAWARRTVRRLAAGRGYPFRLRWTVRHGDRAFVLLRASRCDDRESVLVALPDGTEPDRIAARHCADDEGLVERLLRHHDPDRAAVEGWTLHVADDTERVELVAGVRLIAAVPGLFTATARPAVLALVDRPPELVAPGTALWRDVPGTVVHVLSGLWGACTVATRRSPDGRCRCAVAAPESTLRRLEEAASWNT